MKKPFEPDADYQPDSFSFKSKKAVDEILSRYPKGFQKSAIMPLLDLAQRQVAETGPFGDKPHGGGWIPRAAMDHIAEIVGQPPIKVYEVATFYSMYNLAPVGKYLVQLCTTTPCWLCGSAKVVEACEKETKAKVGETTKDGMFTLIEVECLGACVNAPMVQINDDYFEDLNEDSMRELIKNLRDGKKVSVGSQTGRRGSMSIEGPTTLSAHAKKTGVAS